MILNFLLGFVSCVSLKRGGENPLFRSLSSCLQARQKGRQIFSGSLLKLSLRTPLSQGQPAGGQAGDLCYLLPHPVYVHVPVEKPAAILE